MGGGMGSLRGPDLSTTGRNPSHTVDWFIKFIRNPKAVKPNSRMPAFEDRISPDDLKALAEYLASLK
jgi:cbb3-type cytochrome oxidase cytochrome c subunit